LGAPLGLYLTAAGVGKIGLVDFDVVDFTSSEASDVWSNDVGKPKTEAAKAR
jgi:adenylyltransferase/sulfurtransferase